MPRNTPKLTAEQEALVQHIMGKVGGAFESDLAGAAGYELRNALGADPNADIAAAVKRGMAARMRKRELEAGSTRSREIMQQARKLSDAGVAAQRATSGQNMTEFGAGDTQSARRAALGKALERGMVYGTGFGGMAMTGLPAMTMAKQAAVGTPFSMMSSEEPEIDAVIGGALMGGKNVAAPTIAAGAAGYSAAAEAGMLPREAQIQALAKRLGLTGRYADSSIRDAVKLGNVVTPLDSRDSYAEFLNHTVPGGLEALLKDPEAVAKAKRLTQLNQPWDGPLPYRGTRSTDQDGNHRLLGQLLENKPSLAVIQKPSKFDAQQLYAPGDYSALDQLDQFAKPGKLDPDQAHILSMLTGGLLDNDLEKSAMLYSREGKPSVAASIVGGGHPDTGIPYLSELTTLGARKQGLGREAINDLLLQYRQLHLTPTPGASKFYLKQGAEPLEGSDLLLRAPEGRYAQGGQVAIHETQDPNMELKRKLQELKAMYPDSLEAQAMAHRYITELNRAEKETPGQLPLSITNPRHIKKADGGAVASESITPEMAFLLNQVADRRQQPQQPVQQFEGGAVQRFGIGGGVKRLAKRMADEPTRKGVAEIVKEKGGNWLNGSVEGALGGLKKRPGVARPEEDPDTFSGMSQAAIDAALRDFKLDDFIDKQLTRYVKNEMATPEDPIRALAERGVLHFEPNPHDIIRGNSIYQRQARGFPLEGVAESDAAKRWEDLSDAQIGAELAKDWARNATPETLAKIPGYEKIPGDTPIWDKTSPNLSNNLGFNHLTDELVNAMRPDSGLPRELMLDPASLPRVSVPQAVERVAKINEWRAAQKVAGDQARANNAATWVHKEYAENNPQGLRWVQLTKPDLNEELRTAYMGKDVPQGVQYQALADALKYEGDTMGHCVGGYCDDVLTGKSNIFSLRDAKGQPHVTIETAPQTKSVEDFVARYPQFQEVDGIAAIRRLPEWSEYLQAPADISRVVQIKGKANRKPNDEYLPFVQDFVKSGKWSSVGDLENTGLRKSGSEYFTPEEWAKLLEGSTPGFAEGGAVQVDPFLHAAAIRYRQRIKSGL